MKKFYVFLTVLMILTLLSVTVFVHAGDLPPIPLTTAPESTVPEASTDFEFPVDPSVTTAALFWINETSMDLHYKSTTKLSTNRRVTWSSTNEDVVKVDGNGSITAVGIGTANVKATASDGRTRTCIVKVRYSFFQWCIMILLLGWLWGY
ncbi:MAG: Ig-like domain-containing protein [Clostridia bacterium]|nr:Ig-like domain-containing protein [Clostridia bacterium]